MSVSFNHQWLYGKLPGFVLGDDALPEQDYILSRFLLPFSEQFDEWERIALDEFHRQIKASTAAERFIDYWMEMIFDWTWYPGWFSLDDKRRLFGRMWLHASRRGTPPGIAPWLAEWGIEARAYAEPLFADDCYLDDDEWSVEDVLHIVVDVKSVRDRVNTGLFYADEFLEDDSFVSDGELTLTEDEIMRLVRWQKAAGNAVWVSFDGARAVKI